MVRCSLCLCGTLWDSVIGLWLSITLCAALTFHGQSEKKSFFFSATQIVDGHCALDLRVLFALCFLQKLHLEKPRRADGQWMPMNVLFFVFFALGQTRVPCCHCRRERTVRIGSSIIFETSAPSSLHFIFHAEAHSNRATGCPAAIRPRQPSVYVYSILSVETRFFPRVSCFLLVSYRDSTSKLSSRAVPQSTQRREITRIKN